MQLLIGWKVACYLLGDYAAQKIGGHVWYLTNNHSNFWICVFGIKHPNDSHRLIIPSYEFLYCFRCKTLISFQSSSILLIYWGSPILVKDTATAPGANYCGSVTVPPPPPPPWEKAHHTGDYLPHSLQSVRGFINFPYKLYVLGLWDGAYGLSSLSEKTKNFNRFQVSLLRQHFRILSRFSRSHEPCDNILTLSDTSTPLGSLEMYKEWQRVDSWLREKCDIILTLSDYSTLLRLSQL